MFGALLLKINAWRRGRQEKRRVTFREVAMFGSEDDSVETGADYCGPLDSSGQRKCEVCAARRLEYC